ncbi:hypothetical protein BSM4216_2760 [Bacillus smithii]|nr:hypothetical protein BSM4216_2760 [Bacillus smithii]
MDSLSKRAVITVLLPFQAINRYYIIIQLLSFFVVAITAFLLFQPLY